MRLDFQCTGCVPESVGLAQIDHSRTLGLPYPKRAADRLAVIGGGHSISSNRDRIARWPDDRWFIGSAFQWGRENGIGGAFFSCAPSDDAVPLCRGAARAIVASCSHPDIFSALSGNTVEVFDIENNGATSATTVPWLALQMGYREVRFFGCDSSFSGTTHLYYKENDWQSRLLKKHMMVVRCNGDDFMTCPEFYMQAIFLSELMRRAPDVFVNCSGGLLEAMCADKEYDVIAGTVTLRDIVIRKTRSMETQAA